jgi:hypothetical protein
MPKPNPDPLWSRVERGDGCWLWRGALLPNGYGILRIRARSSSNIYAHRLAWELVNGEIPAGLFVCHRCDVRNCVRPDHLFLGTTTDNMRDMVAKRRQAHGERHGRAKLSAASVAEIRLALQAGASCAALGARYGVSDTVVGRIGREELWGS